MLFYGVYELDHEVHAGFYDSWLEWHSDTFSPDTEVLKTIPMSLSYKGYAARKNEVREKALDFQSLFSLYGVDMSYGELSIWQAFFDKWARRYGLLREFRENGIL